MSSSRALGRSAFKAARANTALFSTAARVLAKAKSVSPLPTPVLKAAVATAGTRKSLALHHPVLFWGAVAVQQTPKYRLFPELIFFSTNLRY